MNFQQKSKLFSKVVCGIWPNYLCPRDGSKGISRSQDRLVVHDRLWGHHGNTPHLMTHLRRQLVRGQVSGGERCGANRIKNLN